MISASCSQSNIEEVNFLLEKPILHAEIEENATSRTYLYTAKYMRWHADDEISAFIGNTLNQRYGFDGETGANSGTFSQVSYQLGTGNPIECIHAVYPYATTTEIDDVAGTVKYVFPKSQQHAVGDTYGQRANPMIATTSGTSDTYLYFRNIGGFLRLQLYGDNVTVTAISIKGNNQERLSGASTITAPYGETPTVVMDDTATEGVILDCGEGVVLSNDSQNPTLFWIVLPPTTFEGGFTITIKGDNGKGHIQSTSKQRIINRNEYLLMPAFSVVCDQVINEEDFSDDSQTEQEIVIPSNQIWYSTKNGMAYDFTQNGTIDILSLFGANLLSNVYYADGKGVITFDDEVSIIGDNAFANDTILTSVKLPNSVQAIGEYAFSGCTSLASVSLGSKVEAIGSGAFLNCSALISISIPESVNKDIGNAFGGCDNLQEFKGKYASDDGRCLIIDDVLTAFAPGGLTSYDIPTGVTSIGSGVFSGCNLTSLTIPEGVETIGSYAFQACVLNSLILPEGVKTIRNNAFSGSSLQTIEFPNSLDSINDHAFSSSAIKSLSLPDNLKVIQLEAFSHCDSLTSITFGQSTAEIGAKAFKACNALTTIDIPSNITVGNFAFSNCSNLVLATIDSKATGHGVFQKCTSLTTVHIGSNVTTISDLSFSDCTSLKTITMGKNVQSIKKYAFRGCSTLTSITIPESVTTIEHYTFAYCTSLSSVFCEAITPPTLKSNAFGSNADNRLIYVPTSDDGSILNAYKTAAGWSDYADYIVEEGPANNEIWYTTTDGLPLDLSMTYPDDGNTFYFNTDAFEGSIVSNIYENGKGVISFDSPITRIGQDNPTPVIEKFPTLKSITIPEGVSAIANRAFVDLPALETLALPSTLDLTNSTFSDYQCSIIFRCPSLKLIKGPRASADGRAWIQDNIMYIFAPAGLTEYTVPAHVTELGDELFHECKNLTSLSLPQGLLVVGDSAIRYCSGLTTLDLPETVHTIGTCAISFCESLKELVIPSKVTRLEFDSLSGNRALTSLSLPEGLTYIDNMVFDMLYNLKVITIPSTVTKIGYCFDSHAMDIRFLSTTPPNRTKGQIFISSSDSHHADTRIYVPAGCSEAYKTAWPSVADIIIEDN